MQFRVIERSYDDICEMQQMANTIRKQIGLSNLMAIGAREYKFLEEEQPGISFKVNRGQARQWMEIYLINDTYTVQLWKKTKTDNLLLEVARDVYCEQIGSIVYHMVNK